MKKEDTNKVVYQHLKPCGEVFYIGIGVPKRPYIKSSRNSHWENIVKKYGYTIEVLFTELTLKEACQIEVYLIKYYGRRDLNSGNLVNKTDGGECKYSISEETKQKIREKRLGTKASEDTKNKISKIHLGSKRSEETKQKMSEIQIGRRHSKETCTKISNAKKGTQVGKNNPYYGKVHSDETREKMSNNSKRKHILLNIETGIFYFGLSDAAKSINISGKCLCDRLLGKSKKYNPFIKV